MSPSKNKWKPPIWEMGEEEYHQVYEKKIEKDKDGNVIVKVFVVCYPPSVEQYNFNVQEPVNEIQIARDGGVNTNKPLDPLAINTGGKAEQDAEKEFLIKEFKTDSETEEKNGKDTLEDLLRGDAESKE